MDETGHPATQPKTGPEGGNPAQDPVVHAGSVEVPVRRPGGREWVDRVAVEEALELRVDGQSLAITLRTPGQDRELAVGLLYAEGILRSPEDLAAVDLASEGEIAGKVVFLRLSEAARERRDGLDKARRQWMATAACGLCGKVSLEQLVEDLEPVAGLPIDPQLLGELAQRMRPAQPLFQATGGIHAAALFSRHGELLDLAEDIGRHNAVDKVVGRAFLAKQLPLSQHILVASGRAGYEIVQKAARAGIPVLASVGAASSLAVDLARSVGLRLFSFVAPGRWNEHR